MRYRALDPGLLKHRLRIEAVAETGGTTGLGEVTRTWSLAGNRWGAIEPLSGRELEYARQVHPEVTHRVTIRHWSAVTANHRVVHDSRVFDIKAVLNPGEENEQLQLLCVENG